MAVSTRTYKKADGSTGTRLVGENGSAQDVGGVLLFDSNGNVLLGQQARAASLPVALSTEDAAVIAAPGTAITGQSLEAGGAGVLGWLASIRKKIAAFGAAGTPSVDVLTVQGIGGGTPQPITSSIFATSRFTSAVVNASTSGNNTLIAGTVGQTIRVFAIDLMMAGAVNIKFRDGASTDLSAAQPFYAGGGKVLDPFPSGDPLFVCTAGNDFVLNLSAAVAVTGTIWYTKG